jgi:hypothetical protein
LEIDRQEVETHPAGESTDNNSPDGWLCELTLHEQATVDAPEMLRSATRRRASDKGLLADVAGRLFGAARHQPADRAVGQSGRDSGSSRADSRAAGIRRDLWPDLVTRFDQMFGLVVGAAQRAAQAGRGWYRGVTHCAAAFG